MAKGEGRMLHPRPIAVAVAALTIVPSPLSAQSPVTVTAPMVRVAHASFADLDLQRAADRQLLHHRIVAAASQVCLDTAIDPLMLDGDRERCWRSAIRSGDKAASDLAEGRLAFNPSQTLAILAR